VFWNWKKYSKRHFAEACYLPAKLGEESITEAAMDFNRNRIKQLKPDFFRKARAKGIPITGGLLKAKAMEFASSLRSESFKKG